MGNEISKENKEDYLLYENYKLREQIEKLWYKTCFQAL